MWILLIASYLILASSSALQLTGDHICQQEERYSVNVTHYFLRNATVRSYKWCMRIPPRCSTFTHRSINESRIVEEDRVKFVPVCCEGYEADGSGDSCIPQCKDCLNGVCNEEHKCYCHPGYRGDHCEKGCEFARWGRYCRYHCTCERGTCNPHTGYCECPNGWAGTRCEHQCQDGYYGHHCKSVCECRPGELCNPADGLCIAKDKIAGIFGSKSPFMKKYHTFDISMLSPKKVIHAADEGSKMKSKQKIVDLYLLNATERFETTVSNGNDTPLDITTTLPAYNTTLEITTSASVLTSSATETTEQRTREQQKATRIHVPGYEQEATFSQKSGDEQDTTITQNSRDEEGDTMTQKTRDEHAGTITQKSRDEQEATVTQISRDEQEATVTQKSRDEQEATVTQKSRDEQEAIETQKSRDEQEATVTQKSRDEQVATIAQKSRDEQEATETQKSRDEQEATATQKSRDEQVATIAQKSRDEQVSTITQKSRDEQVATITQNSRDKQDFTTTPAYEPSLVPKSVEVNQILGVAVKEMDFKIKNTDYSVEVMKRDALKGKAVAEVSGAREGPSGRAAAGPVEVVNHQGSLSQKSIVGAIATGVSILVLLLFAGFYTSMKVLDRKRKEAEASYKKEAKIAADAAFSSKSIFHFPLPDPPTVENVLSTFSAKVATKQQTTTASSTTYNSTIDYLGVFYDHPPSTGSYRAASVPEPPPAATNVYKVPQLILEPIYDEIPSWNQSSGESMYINTTLEDVTKF